MTKYQGLFLRFVLFLFGIVVLIFSYLTINKGREPGPYDTFICVSIGIMYLVIFLPFFFSSINIGNFSGKIPSIAIVWFGNVLYAGASILIIYLLLEGTITLKTATVIQAVLVFIYLINIYFSYFASSHAKNVAEEEADKKYYINKIKSKAGVLLLSVNKLPGGYENAQRTLKQSIDDIKYLSSVNNDAGTDLEQDILRSLGSISEKIGNILSGADNTSLESEANNLLSLIKERKLLRN